MGKRNKKAVSRGSRHGSEAIQGGRRHSTRREESAATQRARLLTYLIERGTVSTLEARGGELRIMHPGGRVLELRQAGVDILTIRDPRQRCGRYVLRGGGHAIEG